jgi:hypothetical protein
MTYTEEEIQYAIQNNLTDAERKQLYDIVDYVKNKKPRDYDFEDKDVNCVERVLSDEEKMILDNYKNNSPLSSETYVKSHKRKDDGDFFWMSRYLTFKINEITFAFKFSLQNFNENKELYVDIVTWCYNREYSDKILVQPTYSKRYYAIPNFTVLLKLTNPTNVDENYAYFKCGKKEEQIVTDMRQFVTDGVYKPFDSKLLKELKKRYADQKIPSNIFQQLNVHTIVFTDKTRHELPFNCNLTGIKVKANATILGKMDLVEYAVEGEEKNKALKKKQEKEEEKKQFELDNQFTLVYKGKNIMKNKDKKEIIKYLEKFVPNKYKNIDELIIKTFKPLLLKYKEKTNKIYICHWGIFYKYECAGETYDIDLTDIVDNNDGIIEEYDIPDTSLIDPKQIVNYYGDYEAPGIRLGIQINEKGKVTTFTEEYDPE